MTRFFLNFPFFKKKKYQQQQLEFRVCVFIKARRELLCSSDGLVSWHNLPAFLPFYYFFSASGRVCISSRFTEIYRHAQHSVDDGWQRFFCSPSILYSNNINVMKSKNFSTLSFVETGAFSSHFLYFQFFQSIAWANRWASRTWFKFADRIENELKNPIVEWCWRVLWFCPSRFYTPRDVISIYSWPFFIIFKKKR